MDIKRACYQVFLCFLSVHNFRKILNQFFISAYAKYEGRTQIMHTYPIFETNNPHSHVILMIDCSIWSFWL